MKRQILSVVLCIILLGICNQATAEKVVLNIAAYHEGYAWTDECVQGISQSLGSEYQLMTYYMNTKQIPKSEFAAAAEMAWEKFQAVKPDAVMLGDDNALMLLGPRFAKSNIAVVFYGINGNPRTYFESKIVPVNIKGVLERSPIISLLRNMTIIFKEDTRKNILSLSDKSTSSAAQLQTRFYGDKEKLINWFHISFEDISEWSDWQRVVRDAHKESAAIALINFHSLKDSGTAVPYEDALKWTSEHTKVPIFLIQKGAGPGKATGTAQLNGIRHGELAAGMVEKLLKGETIAQFIEDKEAQLVFSRSEMKRFNMVLPKEIDDTSIFVE